MKRTKTKLVSSIVTLLICFAMLIGSTFAWFTDSASTGVNKIQAGNLDLVVEHKNANDSDFKTIEDKTNLFKAADGTDMKWEPGAMSWETFKVSNEGSLAFKYVLQTNIIAFNTIDVGGNNKSLKDVLKVKVVTGPNLTDPTRESVAAMAWSDDDPTLDSFVKGDGKLYPNGTTGQISSEEFQVIVYWMPTANDNDWNVNNGKRTSDGEPLFIDFGIKVLATQLEHESDSFDNTYDNNATYSESITTTVNSSKNTVFVSNATPSNEAGKTTIVEFPKETASLTSGSTMKLDIEASPVTTANNNFKINSNGAVGAIDLKATVDDSPVTVFENNEGTAVFVKVTTYIAKNLTNVTLNYGDESWTKVDRESGVVANNFYYEPLTGKMVFATKHFSTFVIGSEDVAYLTKTNTAYSSLYDAFEQSESDDCLVLLKDWTYATSNPKLVNITKSITVDGNGHIISGYGNRGGNNTTIAINNSGSNSVDVTLKNLKIINSACPGRPIETRGNINSLTIMNCDITASGSGNNQGVTVGGNQATSAILNITNSKINVGNAGYPFILFNPVNMTITNSEFVGYCGIYFKGAISSAGSRNSNIEVINTTFDAPNIHSGIDNGFGVFVFEDDGINLDVENCYINSEMFGTANQAMVHFSSSSNRKEQSININIKGNNSLIGKIANVNSTDWEGKYSINIYGGKFTDDPTEYIDSDQYIASQSASGIWSVSKNND